jgi:hypothetical protein
MTDFELALITELSRLRRIFAERNMPRLSFVIECVGRVDSDELKITFDLDSDYNTSSVKGDSVAACVEEFFRRNTWQKAHDYLALPNVPAASKDDQ